MTRAKDKDSFTVKAESYIRPWDGVYVVHVQALFRKPGGRITDLDRLNASLAFQCAVEKHMVRGKKLGAEKYLLLENDGAGALKVKAGDFAEWVSAEERSIAAMLEEAGTVRRKRLKPR